MKQNSFRDAVVVITGASSGIGRATARAFASRGATVVTPRGGGKPWKKRCAIAKRWAGAAG